MRLASFCREWVVPGLRSGAGRRVLWHLAGTMALQGGVFLMPFIVSNLLGKDALARYAMLQNTLVTAAGLAQLSLGLVVRKYVAEYRISRKERAGRVVGFCIRLSRVCAAAGLLAVAGGAPWLSSTILREPDLAPLLLGASIFVPFAVLSGFLSGVLQGLEDFKSAATAAVAGMVVQVGACVPAMRQWGLAGAAGCLVMGAVVQWVLLRRGALRELRRQEIPLESASLGEDGRMVWDYLAPSILIGLLGIPALWLAYAFLLRHPEGRHQLALYAACNNLRLGVLFLPAVLNAVAQSILNRQLGAGEEALHRRTFWTNVGLAGGCVLAVGGVVALLSRPILALYGPAFPETRPLLLLLIFTALLEAVALAANSALQNRDRLWVSLFGIGLPVNGAFVLASALQSPRHGAWGLGLASLVSWSLALILIGALLAKFGLGRARPRSGSPPPPGPAAPP